MAASSRRLVLWVMIVGLLIAVTASVGAALLLSGEDNALSSPGRWLAVRVSDSLTEAPGSEGLVLNPEDLPPLTTELSALIRDAATDPDVLGLFLDVQPTALGWAQIQELRDAVLAFRASGKPCAAWADGYQTREYVLAVACGDLYLAPAGVLLVNGLSVTQTYYGDAFEKYGVSANFEHVGDFKSAVEPYERTGPSDKASEAMDALLDSLYGQILTAIAEGRGVSQEEAAALLDDPPMTPQDALARGLVDHLAYRDEALKATAGEKVHKLQRYLAGRRADWARGDQEIAVLYADGAIVSGDSGSQLMGGSVIGDRTLRRQLEDLREDDDVAAVVLRVNSPGGSGSASDAIWHELRLTQAKKPVVVSMGDYAASGGYYIAMGASRIVAQPGTLTGSIGVFGGKINLGGALERFGLSTHTWQRGRYANLLSSMSDFGEGGRARYRAFLEGFYQTFLERVAEGRGKEVAEVHEVAQGRVWTGQQALDRGLVDQLGDLEDAIALAKAEAGLEEGVKVAIRRVPERRGFFEQLFSEMEDPDPAASLPPEARAALGALQRLEAVLGDGGAAAMLPGELRID